MRSRVSEFCDSQSFSIFTATWNVAGSNTTVEVGDFIELLFPADAQEPSDIYSIAFQETVDLSTFNVVLDDSKAVERSLSFENMINAAFVEKGLDYKIIASRHLVGMLIFVIVKEILLGHISDIRGTTLGVGVMGMMGNKGAVAVRLNVYDTTICFVGSHFTANKKEVQSRNIDYLTIFEKLVFPALSKVHDKTLMAWHNVNYYSSKDLTIQDHSQVFWLGDLNYRIDDVSMEEIMDLIERKDIPTLLKYDQLTNEKEKNNVFQCFKEGTIEFLPTYKYQPGTTLYEQRPGKKKREPAWCDRILYCSQLDSGGITIMKYRRSEINVSDHKPVTATFHSVGKKVNPEREKDVYLKLVREVDRWENDNAPRVGIDKDLIELPCVPYRQKVCSTITISNQGLSTASWRFRMKAIGAEDEIGSISKEWLTVDPKLGVLLSNESINVDLEVYVDSHSVQSLLRNNFIIDDILVLHVEGGRDFFITIEGKIDESTIPSTLGMSVEGESAGIQHTEISSVGEIEVGDSSNEASVYRLSGKYDGSSTDKLSSSSPSIVYRTEIETADAEADAGGDTVAIISNNEPKTSVATIKSEFSSVMVNNSVNAPVVTTETDNFIADNQQKPIVSSSSSQLVPPQSPTLVPSLESESQR